MKFNLKTFEVNEFLIKIHKNLAPITSLKKIEFILNPNVIHENINPVYVTSDKDRLLEVFSNLIENAVDFIPEHGRIEIGAETSPIQVIFYVKDNGIGIPQHKQKNLFKKFYQIDTSLSRSHGGSGLGLVICKGIMKGLGGRIWVKSSLNLGSNFCFSIPRGVIHEKS